MRFVFEYAGSDLYSSLPQTRKAAAADGRIGIGTASHHAPDPSFYQRFRAWPGTPMMAARLQIDVERSAARFLTGLFDREDLSMLQSVISMECLADDGSAVVHQHCTHIGIRRRQAEALLSK